MAASKEVEGLVCRRKKNEEQADADCRAKRIQVRRVASQSKPCRRLGRLEGAARQTPVFKAKSTSTSARIARKLGLVLVLVLEGGRDGECSSTAASGFGTCALTSLALGVARSEVGCGGAQRWSLVIWIESRLRGQREIPCYLSELNLDTTVAQPFSPP